MKKIYCCLLLAACAPPETKSIAVPDKPTKTTPAANAAPTNTATIQPHAKDAASALAAESIAVCGNGAGKRCAALGRLNITGQIFMGSSPAGLGADDLQSAYDLPTDGDVTATVAIVDAFDSPDVESDLATYRQQYGMAACTHANGCFTKYNSNGEDLYDQASSQPTADSDWGGEITLDVEMASAACPKCKIMLVESFDTDIGLYLAQNVAVAKGATVISNSWGGGEYPEEADDQETYFNHPGIATFASTGDGGYGAIFPSTSTYVFGVGGTNLGASDETRGWTETTWGGAGSGCSAYITKPSWQTDGLCPNRAVADVSAVADPYTGVAVYYTFFDDQGNEQGGWMVFGGTSAASPLTAGIFALTGHGGETPEFVYTNASIFNDVTAGSNGQCQGAYLCTAGEGYDGPTGNGTPDGMALAAIAPTTASR